MAIDASIPLGVKTGDASGGVMAGIESGMKLASLAQQIEASKQSVEASKTGQELTRQQIEASKTGQRLTEAQTTGVDAENVIKQRAANFSKWKTENADKYMGPDGSLDIAKFIAHANKAGFATEAQSVAASDLTNKSQAITNATNEQNRQIAMSNYVSTSVGHIANLLDNDKLPQSTRDAMLRRYTDFADQTVPGSGAQILNVLGKQDDKGNFSADPAVIASTAKATMTRQEQINNVINQQNANTSAFNASTTAESVKQAGVVNASGPEERNPASAISIRLATEAKARGLPAVPGVTSAAELTNNPIFRGAVEASNVPAGVKASAAADAMTSAQTAGVYGNTLELVNKLIQRGELKADSNIGAWLNSASGRLSTDPDFRALQAALTQVTAANPAVNINNVSGSALSAQLKQLQGEAKVKSKVAGELAKSVTFTPTQGGAAPNPKQPGGSPNNPVQGIKSREQRNALPAGTWYIDPTGKVVQAKGQ